MLKNNNGILHNFLIILHIHCTIILFTYMYMYLCTSMQWSAVAGQWL